MSDKKEMSLQQFVQSDGLRGEIIKVLPKHITAERFARIAWTAVVRNPDLAHCDRNSLATAIILCAQAGLEPDGRLAHLIPFGKVVQVIFDYKGLLTLAKRNGVDVKASLIFTNDKFEYIEDDGSGKTVVHHSFNPLSNRGELIGVYSRATEGQKPPDYEFMSIQEVEGIKERSRAKAKGPWVTDYGEMVKKTVIKRHSKRWDLLPEIRDVINAEDDTPPPINVSAVSKPIFDKPKPQVEDEPPNGVSTQGAGTANPGGVEVPDTPPVQSAPTSEVKPNPPETTGGFNPLKAVRGLCAEAKMKEANLLAFLWDIGIATEAYGSLEHLHLNQPEVLNIVSQQWADMVKRINEQLVSGIP